MDEEYESLQNNETWDLVSLPLERNRVQCKWIYKTKLAAYGSTTKYKAQLVAKGYSQVHGLDYNEKVHPCCKNGFHKDGFGHCIFEEMGGTSHGCEECLPPW